MLNFTKKTDYALVALASLAEAAPDGPRPQSARAISDRYGVPHSLLMNVLKDLVGGGIVKSTRGAKGGYTLARAPRDITVLGVVTAIEGPVSLTACCDPQEASPCAECSVEQSCPITHSVRRLNDQISRYLHEVTLEDLMNGTGEAIAPVSQVVPADTLRLVGKGEE